MIGKKRRKSNLDSGTAMSSRNVMQDPYVLSFLVATLK